MLEKRITFKDDISYHDWNMVLDFLDHNGFNYEVQFVRKVENKEPRQLKENNERIN